VTRTLVTGATGTVGRRLCEILSAAEHSVVPAARGGSARFDWYRPETWDDVLAGVDRMYLIAPSGDPDPLRVMRPFLRRARASGVTRAVLQSSSLIEPGAPGLGAVHTEVADSFPEWAVLRPSWFMQNFTGSHVQACALRARAELMSATCGGRIGFIDARDIAAAAMAVLVGDAPNRDPILTGPRAMSYDDVAAAISGAAGCSVRHVAVSAARLREAFLSDGLPADYAAMLADLDTLIAAGADDRVTDEVRVLTGASPRTFEQFAAETAWSLPCRPEPASRGGDSS
jgi:uncharacterized protein YbjT (DUF2867 family)